MDNEIRIPRGLKKMLSTMKALDPTSMEQVLTSAEIFACGRVSGRKADYQEGYNAGYAQALKDVATA